MEKWSLCQADGMHCLPKPSKADEMRQRKELLQA